ncbi:GLUG motif-containing protein [Sedimentisphaera salicampi]|uniref:GLUG motif-containing protein n=1 Tax=Sedimentisphaera salicampi TaxID=1941349 RepID=UPI000B9A7FEB|nr:GLUG motif-containing protein [Sedimentisphaera salicampi]OXU14582.1 hypothetical protein SMSP1_01689 [Sedimentisphaera salicampi]
MCTLRVSLLAAIAAASFAFGFAAGDGTENNPYQISTPEHLEAVNDDLSANYVLTGNIDLSARTYDRAVIAPDTDYTDRDSEFYHARPIFTGSPFTGSFDGAGYKIVNLTVDASNAIGDYPCHIGFIGKIEGGLVRNVGIENTVITFEDVYYKAEYLGGLAGFNSGTISNCYSAANVSGDAEFLGSLCGSNSGTIEKCNATGSVLGGRAAEYVAGLCGRNEGGTISNCYATGSVTGDFDLGGLCGSNSGTIINCYATGSVSGSSSLGGLCGQNYYGTISSCFWNTETSGMNTSDGGTGLTIAQMKAPNTFLDAGWDFAGESANGIEDIWVMPEDGYPRLAWSTSDNSGGINPADLNNDGIVDILDFAIFSENWLLPE